VSPLWRDQIRIALAPQQVTLLRLRRGWTPRVTEKRVIPCVDNKPGEPLWHNAITTLASALPEFAKRKSEVVVILSNHFVRYALIPYSEQISRKQEELALVRHQFTQIYGEAVEQWALRLSDDGCDDNRVASAIDQALLDALHAVFQSGNLILTSVQPYLMAAFNQWQHRFADSALFALIEHGRLCLSTFHHRQWHAIKSIKIGEDWYQELAALLNREKLLSGIDVTGNIPVFIVAPDAVELNQAQQQEHAIQLLRPKSLTGTTDAKDASYFMAMAG